VLSGADDVCVYSIGGGNGNGKNSPRGKNAQLTCWNSSQVTASEWIDNDNFIIGEASGMITIDKANQDYFRQLDQYEDFIPETTPIRKLVSHTGGIYKFALHPSQKGVFASCSVDCSVKVWNIGQTLKVRANSADLKPIKKLTGHFGYVVDILWLGTKDSARLASASADGTVKIWNTDKSECLMTLQEGMGAVNSISATQSGQYLASAGHDGHVYFWNVASGALTSKYETSGRIMVGAFNSSNNKYVMASYGSITILELSYYPPPSPAR
jgi:WD40 repeat protein